jgi:ABC-type glycerol-3-phosphate transport system substrate-binding protein
MSAFGLMYNMTTLISTGYTPSDISDLNSFSTVVQQLGQQGYTVFAGRGLTDGVVEMLASLPGNIRTLTDLWLSYGASGDEETALERFLQGKALFYLGSIEEYQTICDGAMENIGILPIYLDDQPAQTQSLCVTAEEYWCVAGDDPAETAAAMAFLDYLVQADEQGNVPVDKLEILAPYRQATYSSNPLEQILRQDLTAGKGYLVCHPEQPVPEGFMEALRAYTQDPTDENWQIVESLK